MPPNRSLKSLSEQIQKEVWALSGSIDALKDKDLVKEEYLEYQKHINWIQNLFDESSEQIKQLDLSQDNPTLYDDLVAKREIAASFNLFSKIRSAFWKRYREREKSEFERERVFEEPKKVEEEDINDDWLKEHNALLEQQALEEEAAFLAFMEQLEAEALEAEKKKEKADKKNTQQQRMADDAQKRQDETAAFYEKKRQTEEELQQSHENQSYTYKTEPNTTDYSSTYYPEENQYTDTKSQNPEDSFVNQRPAETERPLHYDTYEEQHKREYYQKEQDVYEERLRSEQEKIDRTMREEETMDAYRRKMDAVENYESISKSHIDMSSEELQKAFHGDREHLESSEEPIKDRLYSSPDYANQKQETQLYEDTYKERQNAEFSRENAEVSGAYDSYQLAEESHYEANIPHDKTQDRFLSEEEQYRKKQQHEESISGETQSKFYEQSYPNTADDYKREPEYRSYEEQRYQEHLEQKQYQEREVPHEQQEPYINFYEKEPDIKNQEIPISYEEHYRNTHGGHFSPEALAAYEAVKQSGYEADNERLYNHLYYQKEHSVSTDPVFVSSEYDALLYHNVEIARNEYLEKKGTAEEQTAKEYYDKQRMAYNTYQNNVDRGAIAVDDRKAKDTSWLVPIKPLTQNEHTYEPSQQNGYQEERKPEQFEQFRHHEEERYELFKQSKHHENTTHEPFRQSRYHEDTTDESFRQSKAQKDETSEVFKPFRYNESDKNELFKNPGYQEEYFRYVPGGVVHEQIHHLLEYEKAGLIARDNAKLLATISDTYKNQPSGIISPQVETLMQYNLDMAKQQVLEKRGTLDEASAIHSYLEQRKAYAEYHKRILNGEITVKRPDVTQVDYTPYNVLSKPDISDDSFTIHSFVPGGIESQVILNNQIISNFRQNNESHHNNVLYTKQNPLIVTPEYDRAMQANLDRVLGANHIWLNPAKSNTALLKSASALGALELKLATDANLEYQKAKLEGRVIVSEQGKESVPDFGYWQSLKTARNQKQSIHETLQNAKDNQAPLGSTLHTKRVHDNTVNSQAEKAAVENINRGLLGSKSLLKYRDNRAGSFHGSTQTSMYMLRTVRRKMYSILQSDETGAIGEFEAFRQYSLPIRQFASAQAKSMFYNSAVIAHRSKSHEMSLFGDRANLSDSELKSVIHDGKKQNRLRKKEMKALMEKGSLLSPDERKKLTSLISEHAISSRDLKKNIALLEHRTLSKEQLALVQTLEDKNIFGFKSQKVLRELHYNTIQEHRIKTGKKFGKLSTATDKSIQKEIQATMATAKDLKANIKRLEAKGSLLSASERKELLALKEAHGKLNLKLKKLFGVKGANEELKRKLAVFSGAEKIVGYRWMAIKQGGYTLNSVLIRSLRQSDEAGLIGVAKAAELSSNYYVRQVAKKSVINTLKAGKFILNKTGVSAAAKWTGNKVATSAPVQATKKVMMKPVDGTKKIVTKQIRKVSRLRTKFVDSMKSRVPQPIKTGMHAMKTAATKALQPVNLAWKRFKDKVSNSFVGRAYRTFNKVRIRSMEALTKALGVTKMFILKVLIGIVIFYVVVGLIIMFLTLLSTPMILIMDDPANIKDYTELCQSWNKQFDKDIEEAVDDHRIFVKGQQVNTVQVIYINGNADNTKEIISMAAVYLSQDFSDRNRAKKYMKGLHDDSHTYNVVATDMSMCAGCECPGNHCNGHTSVSVDKDGNVSTSSYTCSGCYKCDGCECPGHQNYDVNVIIHTFDTIFEVDSQANVGRDLIVDKDGYLGTYKITAYCGCEECCGKTDGITASGTEATEGRTIAVDPNVIPYGTTVWINGNPYVAEDCGGGIDGKEIDMYFKSHKKALEWGVKTYPVYSSKVNNSGDDGKDYTFDGWYDANREWAKRLYEQDWNVLYEVNFIAGGVLSPDYDAFFIPEEEAKGLTNDQLQMVDVATHSGSYGIPAQAGYCQKWVKQVYQKATGKVSAGAASANVAGRQWAISAKWDDIPVGASVYGYGRTPSTNPYGHVGIYIGNGIVLHNVGGVASDTLDEWVQKYNGYGWGWQNGDSLQD